MSDYPSNRGWGGPGLSRTALVNCPGSYPLHANPGVQAVMQRLVDGIAAIRVKYRMSPISASGAYNKRYIANTTVWSNHSWGIAADLNAATNPYSYSGQTDFSAAAQAEVRALCRALMFRWGLDYSGKKDAMHFEFMGTPADAARLGNSHPVITPIPPATLVEFDMARFPVITPDTVGYDANKRVIQGCLKAAAVIGLCPDPGPIDGDYGPATQASVKAYQRSFHLEEDAKVGEQTYNFLYASV